MTALPRRRLLQAVAGLAAVSACAEAQQPEQSRPATAYGVHQAGVTTPQQGFVRLVVLDHRAGSTSRLLDVLGERIERLVSGRFADVPEPGDLTVTVGVGEPELRLPAFSRDDYDERHDGGDLVLQVCGSDPVAVLTAADHLTSFSGDLHVRWAQLGFAGAVGQEGFGRNLLGFHDGIVEPRSTRQRATGVWRRDGSTLMVVRRIVLDVDRFTDLPLEHQERIIGRRKSTGVPLSGGHIDTPLDLAAKTPAGAYLIPADAHVRRAHPLAAGHPLMLRRGFSFADSSGRGLLFLSFQADLAAFVQTQYRLDSGDALNRFGRVTASGVFRVLPGYSAGRGLGAAVVDSR